MNESEMKEKLDNFRHAFLAFIDALKSQGVNIDDRDEVLMYCLMAAGFALPARIDQIDDETLLKISKLGMAMGSAVYTWLSKGHSEEGVKGVVEIMNHIKKDVKGGDDLTEEMFK